MRTIHAILPGHTSLGTINGNTKHVQPLFSFLIPLSWQKVRPADTRENISLSNSGQFQQQIGTIHLERAHFNICSSAYCGGFVCNFGYFSRCAFILYGYCSLNYSHHKYNQKLYNRVKEME